MEAFALSWMCMYGRGDLFEACAHLDRQAEDR